MIYQRKFEGILRPDLSGLRMTTGFGDKQREAEADGCRKNQ